MNITQPLDLSTINLINKLLSTPIGFQRAFAEIGGGATEGLFLSQLYAWTNTATDGEGWVEKTYQQWHELTYLSRRELDAARKKLKALGVLEEKKVGSKQNILYKLDIPKLFRLIVESCNLSTAILDQAVTVEVGFEGERNKEVKQIGLFDSKAFEASQIARPPIEIPVPMERVADNLLSLVEPVTASNVSADSNNSESRNSFIPTPLASVPVTTEYQPLPLHKTYSSAQKCDDRFKPKPLPPWRVALGKNGYKPEVLKYLKDIYLPKTPHYEGKEVSGGEASRWLIQREYDEKGLGLIEAMMADYQEYITSPAANAARVMEEIENLPSWVKTSWAWVKSQYQEYLDCKCELSKFHYTKSQAEIDVWELWISRTFPDNAPKMFAEKKRVLSKLRIVA